MKRNSTLYFAVALLALSLTPGVIYAQNLGDSKVFSPVAAPGFPEGIAVNGNTVLRFRSRRIRPTARLRVRQGLRNHLLSK